MITTPVDFKPYDGTKLLSLRDINGNKPEIYICTSNRTGGKTTYFNRLLVNRFLKTNKQFCLLYRFKYELSNVSERFFGDIKNLFFNNYRLEQKKINSGNFIELFLGKEPKEGEKFVGKPCGYAISINSADQIKKNSHLFSNVSSILFDEFQSETNQYAANEIAKFISIHTSIARGGGKQVRYVPVYMVSNPVSIINPYYAELGISNRLTNRTKFLKGNGWVLEQGFNEDASIAQRSSAFNKAFQNNDYVAYSSQGIYLSDNNAFIEKITDLSNSIYLLTIIYENNQFALRLIKDRNILYLSTEGIDEDRRKIVFKSTDHNINYLMLNKSAGIHTFLLTYFNNAQIRFNNLLAKQVLINILNLK